MKPVGIVVPVKPFHAAKRRLSPMLAPSGRATLVRAMLEDVLAVATDPGVSAVVFVVTADPRVANVAMACGASVLMERRAEGMSEAVRLGELGVRGSGCETLVVLPADVPLVTPDDLHAIAQARTGDRDVVLVPARRDGGTNAIACATSVEMPFLFGMDSFDRHAAASIACGLTPRRLALERLALDVDTPADIEALVRDAGATRAQRWLRAPVRPDGAAQRREAIAPRRVRFPTRHEVLS
jgi:2-phospho-L-lactate guanylyltransferase